MAEYDFITTDAATIVKRLVTDVETEIGEPLYPGDERRLFCEALAVVLVQMFNEINDQCRQRLLRYARNEVLDALGERVRTERLAPAPAKTILQFSLEAARDRQTYIPTGTRATPDGSIHFATTEAAIIQPGEISVTVPAECTTGGASYNGYSPGSINTITDSIAYVAGVSNTVATHDGDDGEPQDDGGAGDDRYRERIQLAPAKFSCAGAESAYKYYALSADSKITDVNVCDDHDAGTVDIIVITTDGNPSEDTLAKVVAACNAAEVRPMNDKVNAIGPTRASYDINIKYYCTAANEQATIATIESTGGAIDRYNEWQQDKIGRDINPDQLRGLCLAPNWDSDDTTLTGALRIEVTSPSYKELTERELAEFSGKVTVTHAVVEE